MNLHDKRLYTLGKNTSQTACEDDSNRDRISSNAAQEPVHPCCMILNPRPASPDCSCLAACRTKTVKIGSRGCVRHFLLIDPNHRHHPTGRQRSHQARPEAPRREGGGGISLAWGGSGFRRRITYARSTKHLQDTSWTSSDYAQDAGPEGRPISHTEKVCLEPVASFLLG